MKKITLLAALLLAGTAWGQTTIYVTAKPHNALTASTITVDTSAYAAKDSIGGKLAFTKASCASGHGRVSSVVLSDKSDNAVEYDLVLFTEDPTTSTITDQAAFDPADADLSKILPVINLSTTDHFSFNDNGVSSLSSLGSGARTTTITANGGIIYAALVARGTPTYASASDVTITLGLTCDK